MNDFGPPPYPLKRFYAIAFDAASDLERNVMVPDALIGTSLLAMMATICQRDVDVRLPTGSVRPTSLALLTVAESGERKTTVDRWVFKPLYDYDERMAITWEAECDRQEKLVSLWEDTTRALRRKRTKLIAQGESTDQINQEIDEHALRKPQKPRLRQTVRRDMSGRALADALHGESEAIAVMSDEGTTILRSDVMRQLGMLNSAWDGSTLKLDRADGRSVLARQPRMTLHVCVQPDGMRNYLSAHGEQARGSGHFARYLVAWPASTQGTRITGSFRQCWDGLDRFHERAAQLLADHDRRHLDGNRDRIVLDFTEEAKREWIALANDVERSIGPQGHLHDVSDFGSKCCEIVARVAAVMHYFSAQEGPINVDSFDRAKEIVGWHLDEFQRFFGTESDLSIVHDDAKVLATWFHKKVWLSKCDHMPRNDLLSLGPTRLRKKARLDPAIALLAAHGAIRVEPDRSGKLFVHLLWWYFNNYIAS